MSLRCGYGCRNDRTRTALRVCSTSHGNGEQKLNAADHVAQGGALLVADHDLTSDYVRGTIFPLLGSEKLSEMAIASRALAHPDGAQQLADLIESTLQKKDQK